MKLVKKDPKAAPIGSIPKEINLTKKLPLFIMLKYSSCWGEILKMTIMVCRMTLKYVRQNPNVRDPKQLLKMIINSVKFDLSIIFKIYIIENVKIVFALQI